MSKHWAKWCRLRLICILACGLGAASLQAGPAILTGYFDGSEPLAGVFEEPADCGQKSLSPYFDSGTFQVSTTEMYTIFDAHFEYGLSTSIGLYSGNFIPGDVTQNRLALIHGSGQVNLQAGTNYRIVAQPQCFENDQTSPFQGPFGVGIVPAAADSLGTASGGALRPLPGYMHAVFDGDEPSTNIGQGDLWYEVKGLVQIRKSGYYFISTSFSAFNADHLDLAVGIYAGPFYPDSNENRPIYLAYNNGFPVYLEANHFYSFVLQPRGENRLGRAFFTMAPPAGFFVNPGMNGGWFNPELNGQGFFVDVLAESGTLFLGWYTFDVTGPLNPAEATLGYAGSRWLTAIGPYYRTSAELDIELTTGGRFRNPRPVSRDPAYGTISLEFQDCENGTVTYDISSAGVAGQMSISRIAGGNRRLCSVYSAYPGALITD